jgi:hypothetical protein
MLFDGDRTPPFLTFRPPGGASDRLELLMDLARIQQELRNQGLDGWLFFDHHMRDPLRRARRRAAGIT